MTGRKKSGARPQRGQAKKPSRADQADKAAKAKLTHDDLMKAAARIDPDLRRRSELLWADRSPSTRGPKAGITPEEIVEVAIDIAEEKGVAGVTMHAVAAALGFSTMALYRYFPNKEALLDALVDAGTGRPPAPSAPGGDWRSEVARWAHAKRAMLCTHPWLAELPFVAAPHGPNWLRWVEALTDPLSRTGLAAADVGQMISVIDGYTRGASDTAVSLARARARGTSEGEWAAAVGADLGRSIGDSRFPAFAALLTAPPDGQPRTMDESFDFGLQRVLDGIELYIDSVTTRSTSPHDPNS